MESENSAVLYVFSGLPGVGKTSIARLLSRHLNAVYLRIDTVEQGLRDLCGVKVEGEGYRLCHRIAADNLREGHSVVADCCNPVDLTRDEWEKTACSIKTRVINIEVVCSDLTEHRRRVETRGGDVPGLKPPQWCDVQEREFHPWTRDRIVVETAGRSIEESFNCLLSRLSDKGLCPG